MKTRKLKKLRKKCMLKNLLLVALADGKVNKEELEFLKKKAQEYEIGEEELAKILKHPEKVKAIYPNSLGARIEVLYELVEMMLSDGIIERDELLICKNIAAKMGVYPELIEQIVKDLDKSQSYAA